MTTKKSMSQVKWGNEWYRRLIRSNRPLYRACPKHTKLLVSKAIVQAVEQQGGRFLDRDKSNGKWFKVSYKRAVDKTSQGLRERDRDDDASGDDDDENGADPVTVPESFSGRNAKVNLNELASVAIQHANSGVVRAPSAHISAPQLGGAISSLGTFAGQYTPMMARQPMEAMMSPEMQQQRVMSAALKQQRMDEFNDDMNPLPPGLAMRQSSMFQMLKHVQLLPGVSDIGQAGRQPGQLPFPTKLNNLPEEGKQKRKRSLIDDDNEEGVGRSFNGQTAAANQMLQSTLNASSLGNLAVSASQPPLLQPGISSQLLQSFGTPAFPSFQSIPSLGANQLRSQQMNSTQFGQSQLLQQMNQNSQAQLMNQMQLQQQRNQGQGAVNQVLQLKQAQVQQQLNQGQFPFQGSLNQQFGQGQMMNHLQLQQQLNTNQLQLMNQLQRQSSGGLSRLSSAQNMPAPPLGVQRLPSQISFQPFAASGMNTAVGVQDDPVNAPSFTRLKTQVSDWLKNSFWPVGSNPPTAPQQAELHQQQFGGGGGQGEAKAMSQQLAVNTATAIAKMIPPPIPGAMQDRKGAKRQKFGSDNGSMGDRQTPIITTVPPPGPQRSIQINTIPPISSKSKQPTGKSKQKVTSEIEEEAAAAAAMTSEVERSVSASLLTLASAPTGLFKGLSTLFSNPSTSVVMGTQPIPPNVEARPPSPDFPAAGLKKSKKSLLDDDDDERPEEARLRTVPW